MVYDFGRATALTDPDELVYEGHGRFVSWAQQLPADVLLAAATVLAALMLAVFVLFRQRHE